MAAKQDRSFDPTRIGEADDPQNDWGDPETGAEYGGNHTRRGEAALTQQLQGVKTRTATKDQISRRS
jgi:hypothetical protein